MKAEDICKRVSEDIKPQAVTLASAVLAMQRKIDQQIPIYDQMPLAQTVTVGTGERMLRQNPAAQEFRAIVRDYSTALNALYDLIDERRAPAEVNSLAAMRGKLKAVK